MNKIKYKHSLEFIITDHAREALERRFNCKPNKFYKIMLKAWKSNIVSKSCYAKERKDICHERVYKMFNGFVFIFKIQYNKKLELLQKYLITVYKKTGYQFED